MKVGIECWETLGYQLRMSKKDCPWKVETPTFGQEEEVIEYLKTINLDEYDFTIRQIRVAQISLN